PEGELTDGILDQLAKFERAKTAERTRRGKLRRAREGKVIAGHTPPYGFGYNDARDNLVPDEEQMRVAQRILRELAGGVSVFGISQTLMREGVPAPRAGANWNHAAIRRIALSDLYARHTADEVRGMVSTEVAARLDPETEYGIWHFNTKRTTRSYVSKVGPNGKEYAERQRTHAKPKEEWIAVPVPLGEDHGVSRATVEVARETMRSRARHYRQTSRVWELAGGVFRCAHCDRMMSFANVKRRNGKRMAYYRCQGHRRNGHKEGCPNARHYRALETEDLVWRFVRGLLTDPDRLRRGLDAMIEEKRRGLRGDPDRESRFWLERIADADRQRARAQDLAIEGLLSPEELRSKLSALEGTREAAARELEALRGHREEAEQLERDRDALLAGYAGLVPQGLDAFEPEDRRWTYGRIRLKVFGHSDGTIVATWAFGQDAGVISEYTHQDEGNAYLRLGEVLTKLGREDEAREAYGTGVGQAEKFGHSGMAEDLRLAQIQLGG
ncbi:MAG TPA: recombinase zinc beta ribbon domain-containing protein, partial [Rubrobacter sp.]|nr:recombinase zinc beta ribbon domain-containing protein [Rubrobacter sp.]